MRCVIPILVVAITSAGLWAQAPESKPQQPTAPPPQAPAAQPPAGQPAATAPATEDAKAKKERLLKATRLPKKAAEVRAKGVPDSDVKEAMRAAKAKGVKAGDMADVTDAQSKSVDEHGPIDNFGAFVKTKLDEGLRGRDLAAAIHAEHAKRGKGKGHKPDKADKGKGNDKGKPDDKKPDDKKPDEKGKGKPNEKGKG